MQIFVKSFTGKTMVFDAEPDSTVNNIKSQISDITGVGQRIDYQDCSGDNRSHDPLRLIYGGKQLENAKSLCDYGIRHESILHLVHRLPGA
ncbi:Ubiquitin-related domain containing protein [Lactarius tabidus]